MGTRLNPSRDGQALMAAVGEAAAARSSSVRVGFLRAYGGISSSLPWLVGVMCAAAPRCGQPLLSYDGLCFLPVPLPGP